MSVFAIRPARPDQAGLMLTLLTELAAYEKLLDKFFITEATIARDYFGAHPVCACDIAYRDETPIGLVTYYWTYSSFYAARALYLEDLFVRPEFRGRGDGKALLAHLAAKASAMGAIRIEWMVLDWNAPSIEFYKSIGARPHEGWLTYRLEDAAMKTLGGG